MTPEQQVALDALRNAWPEAQVARMVAALEPDALLVDHADDLTEAYWHLCSKLMWTFVTDGPAHPEYHLLRAARELTRDPDTGDMAEVWPGVRSSSE